MSTRRTLLSHEVVTAIPTSVFVDDEKAGPVESLKL